MDSRTQRYKNLIFSNFVTYFLLPDHGSLGHVITGGQVQTVGFLRIGELVRGRNTGSHALAVVNIHQPELSLKNCKLRSTNTFIPRSVDVQCFLIVALKH